MYETSNKILFQYQDVTSGDSLHQGTSATVGIQKNQTDGIEYSCNLPSLSDGMAIMYSPYTELSAPFASSGLDYDCHRNGVWVASENGELNMYDPDTATLVKTIPMTSNIIVPSSNSNGVAVLDNGNLLLSDFNGDGDTTIDDYIFEFNPDDETLVNYWPIDGALNTSTDGTNIDRIRGVEMIDERFRHAYVTRSGDNNVYEIQLLPGKPGTWKTVAVHAPPFLTNSAGIDKVACYEDTPITGLTIADRGSSTINYYNTDFTVNSNFNTEAGFGNYGVTVVPGNPAKLWVANIDLDNITIVDTEQKCTMHCGKFPWHEIIGALSQGSKQNP